MGLKSTESMTRHERLTSDCRNQAYLTETKRQELAATPHVLNPILLLKQINENLDSLWKLAERPAHQQRKIKTCEALVT